MSLPIHNVKIALYNHLLRLFRNQLPRLRNLSMIMPHKLSKNNSFEDRCCSKRRLEMNKVSFRDHLRLSSTIKLQVSSRCTPRVATVVLSMTNATTHKILILPRPSKLGFKATETAVIS